MLVGFDYFGKYSASFCEWKASQVTVFVRKDIEGVVDNARLSSSRFLKEVEISAATWPYTNYLAVDDGSRWQVFQRSRDITESIIEYVSFARVKSDVIFSSHGFKSIAIELDFVGPLWSLRKRGDRQTIHCFNEACISGYNARLRWHSFLYPLNLSRATG